MSNIKNVNIDVSSTPFQIEQGEIEHAKTEYLISRYPSGVSSDYKIVIDSPITSYKITDVELDNTLDWYVFTRYDGNDNKTKSPWSYPVKYTLPREDIEIYAPEIETPYSGQRITTNLNNIQVRCSQFTASHKCNHSSTKYTIYGIQRDGKKDLMKTVWIKPITEFMIDVLRPGFSVHFPTYSSIELRVRYYGNNNTIEGEEGLVEFIIS